MVSSLRWYLVVAAALACAVVVAPAADPPADKKAAPAKSLDALKLPADAIIVVIDKPGDLLNLVPIGLILPEKIKEKLDELARMRENTAKETPSRPSKLHLKGRVEGDRVFLQAQFDFVTDRPKTVVALGCKPAQANNALLSCVRDGDDPKGKVRHVPALRSDADGLSIFMDEAEPRGCTLNLDLTLEVTTQGTSRALELKLPQAAATTLDLTLPGGSHDVRFADHPLLRFKSSRVEGTLGAADKLALSWKEGKAAGTGPKILEAEGKIHVRFDGRNVSSEAKLTLKVRGSTDRWELLVPPGADLSVDPADRARVDRIDSAPQPFASLRTIRLKEASDEPLNVTVKVPAPETRSNLVPVGPFIVRGALRQSGSIVVTGTGPEPRLLPHGDTTQRELTREEKDAYNFPFVRAFGYDQVPQPLKPTAADGDNSYSLLDVGPDATRGLVQTRTKHTLEMQVVGERRQWVVVSQIDARLLNQGTIERLEVQLPAGSTLLPADPGPLPPGVSLKEEPAKVILSLPGEPWKEFSFKLQVLYPIEVGSEGMKGKGEAAFELPRALAPAAGSRVEASVKAPRDVELLAPEQPGMTALTVVSPHELAWKAEKGSLEEERPPSILDVAWRPYRPEFRRQTADVTLTTPEGQAQVRHTLHYRFPSAPKGADPLMVMLRLPPAVQADTFEVVSGGELQPEDAADPKNRRRIGLKAPAGQDAELVVQYSFLQPALKDEGDTTFAVSLAMPEQVTRGETKVRVWSDSGTLPEPARSDDGWTQFNIEKDRGKTLPVLVLQTQRVDLPLTLRLAAVVGERSTVLADRALIRVEVTEGEGHRYRASFLLTQLLTRQLDIELPAPERRLGLEVTLDGKQVPREILDDEGQRSDRGRVARLRLNPDLVHRSVLQISYTMPPGQVEGGVFRTTLQPPVLRGEPGRVLTRWQVTLPAGWVPLGPEGGAGTPRIWGRSGWLLVPHLGVSTGDMERWFAGNENVPYAPGPDAAANPHLVCLRSGLAPLTVTYAPFKPWLASCSLAVLLIGLAMYFLARRAVQGAPGWFWVCGSLVLSGVGVLWLFRPTALAALAYGGELGAAVLLVFAALFWLMHERQRRQIVFLPSFRRGGAGSSLIRATGSANGSSPRPQSQHGEPSTVDAPRPTGSSHSAK